MIKRLEMKNYNTILIERLKKRYRSSGENDKYQYLTDEEIAVELYANKKDNLLFLKQKKIFIEYYNKRLNEIDRFNKEIVFNGLNFASKFTSIIN